MIRGAPQNKKLELPSYMQQFSLAAPKNIVDLLVESGLASSKSDSRRLVQQGAVHLDDEVIGKVDALISVSEPAILRVGKRRFLRLLPPQ